MITMTATTTRRNITNRIILQRDFTLISLTTITIIMMIMTILQSSFAFVIVPLPSNYFATTSRQTTIDHSYYHHYNINKKTDRMDIPNNKYSSRITSTTTIIFLKNSKKKDEMKEEHEDPDLLGVSIDGFPLPPIPVFPNDEQLIQDLYKLPISKSSLEQPIPPPLLSSSMSDTNTKSTATTTTTTTTSSTQKRPLRVVIAGGGLGGLALASALMQNNVKNNNNNDDNTSNNGLLFDVHVYEQAKQYKPFGGPIQIQSNALWALQQIHPTLYDAVAQCGVQTGDRLSGIKDGKRYQEGWLVKFDAATPAIAKGLPLTLAINRVVLQDIFLKYGIPPERIHTQSKVIGYSHYDYNNQHINDNIDDDDYNNNNYNNVVAVHLQDNTTIYADLLVGADGIWSTVRHQMVGLPMDEIGPKFATKHSRYSGYTCFTGTCRHVPKDIDEVAYKVFLGQEQYLGCTDAGNQWQHWWAFLPDPPGGIGSSGSGSSSSSSNTNGVGGKQQQKNDGSNDETVEQPLDRLKREFHDWSPEILDLFHATDPKVVRQRDLFDRPPMIARPQNQQQSSSSTRKSLNRNSKSAWIDGHVVLLGDAAHPTMPNLGQGGAMAIEDAYVLGQELNGIQHINELDARLKRYESRRYLRASIAQYLSRNGSDLLVDWDKVRNTPIVGPIAMWFVNVFQPISMNYLYSADI